MPNTEIEDRGGEGRGPLVARHPVATLLVVSIAERHEAGTAGARGVNLDRGGQ